MKGIFLLLCLSSCSALAVRAADLRDDERRIRESAVVLSEILHAPDRSIPTRPDPQGLLRRRCSESQACGICGGGQVRQGSGDVPHPGGWSAPSVIRIEGGSFGFQIGLGETDVVFTVMNPRGMHRLTKDEFTVGGDASAMAGPVGRSTQATTDVSMNAEILAWSRSRELFAGVSLEGATLRPDNADNDRLYGRPVRQSDLIHGRVKPTPAAWRLFDVLNRRAPIKRA